MARGIMERFVVGTGRCGSTLLSRMLAENTSVLSIFEFFTGLDMLRRFGPEPVDGDNVAQLVSAEQPMVTAVLRRGYTVEEITYPFDHTSPGKRRFQPDEPLPWILVSTLGRLSDDPDALFDEVMTQLRGQPKQLPREHWRELFGWLADRLGCEMWIERSGSSIEYLGSLKEQFPDARFLHLHRDNHEVACSMREHHAYRLPISLLYDARLDSGKHVSELGPIDVHAAPTGSDPITQILESRPPPAAFGRYCNDQVLKGFRALSKVDADQYLEVRFEDLVANPRVEIERISDFFELPPGPADWIGRAASIVRGPPPTRFDALSREDQDTLREACRPGQVLLGRSL
jgi:hypothetical protein